MPKAVDVGEARKVAESQWLFGQERTGQQRQRGVLRATDRNLALEAIAAADPDAVHRRALAGCNYVTILARYVTGETVGMSEHDVPRKVIDFILADLKSRIAEFGAEQPEGISKAVAILEGLPGFDEGAELTLQWYSENPPEEMTFEITERLLELTANGPDGSQELYSCEAEQYPSLDSDWASWLLRLRGLNSPELSISYWEPAEVSRPARTPLLNVTIAKLDHPNFLSRVTAEITSGGDLKLLVYDSGAAPEACFGGDYDRWVTVPADAKDDLLIALIADRYKADMDAVAKFKSFCAENGIDHRFDTH